MNRNERIPTQVRAWGQCEMYLRAPGGGRCARSTSQEAHHIVKRSLGGGDEPENIAELCTEHHAEVERRSSTASWLYLVRQDDGTDAYATTEGGEAVWFLWPNIRNEMRGVADGLVNDLQVATAIRVESGWRLLDTLAAMEAEGDMWNLTHGGLDGLAIELGSTPHTLRRYLKMGREYRRLDIETQEWLRKHSPTVLGRARLAELPPADLEAVRELIETTPDVNAVIVEGRQRAALAQAEGAGKVLSEVTLIADAATFSVDVEHARAADPIELAKRRILSGKAVVGVSWKDKLHQVERIETEEGNERGE